MRIKPVVAAAMLIGVVAVRPGSAQVASSEQEFRQVAAALKANDAERRSAIATCIKQGIGENPAGVAQFMSVPVEKATEA